MHRSYVPVERKLLTRLYVDERLTTGQIAQRLGCTATTILRRLRRFGIAPRPRGPRRRRETSSISWSRELAYSVGLIATDGNLSQDGRHLAIPSKDLDLLESLRRCLGLDNRITRHGLGHHHRLQWGDRHFYTWLTSIGLTPRKSLTLGPIAVPDEYFADFYRGCIDGDGSITTYVDRHNDHLKPTYVYTRLYVSIVSASPQFVEWLRATVRRLSGLSGELTVRKSPVHNDLWRLRYAKRESLALLRWIYYAPDVPCLRRKRDIAAAFLARREQPPRLGPGRPVVV